MTRLYSLLAVSVLGTACFTAELDLQATGAYACTQGVDGAPCPEGQTCSSNRCRSTGTVPAVSINAPADGASVAFDPMATADIQETIQFSIESPFELVDPAVTSEHVFGQGHVIVRVDGAQVALLSSGSVSGGREVGVAIPNVVGAHRISVALVRNDGEPYDHPAAHERNLFWLSDGTPRVAITRPWPGEVFSLESQEIPVEVGVVDFALQEAGSAPAERQGHAHVHYDAPFPECPDLDDGCDGNYIVIVDTPTNDAGSFAVPAAATVAVLPAETAEREVEVSVILRHLDHRPYRLPDRAQDTDDPAAFSFPPQEGDIVLDTITVVRQQLAAP